MADDEQQPLLESGSEQQPLIPKRAAGPSRGLVFVAVFGAALLLGAAVSARGGAAQQPQALRASAPAGRPVGSDEYKAALVDSIAQIFAQKHGRAATAAEREAFVEAVDKKQAEATAAYADARRAFAAEHGREPDGAELTAAVRATPQYAKDAVAASPLLALEPDFLDDLWGSVTGAAYTVVSDTVDPFLGIFETDLDTVLTDTYEIFNEVFKIEETMSYLECSITPIATSCHGWDCSCKNQVCLQGTPGAAEMSYCCVEVAAGDFDWIPVSGQFLWDIKCPVTCWGWDCSASDEGLYCPPGNPGSTGADGSGYCCRGESWVAGPCPNDCVDKGPQSWAAGDCDGPPYDPNQIGVFELQGDDENCLTPIPITAGFYVYVGVDILEDSAVVGLGDVVPDGASPASRPV